MEESLEVGGLKARGYKAAIVGCGRISRNHARAYRRLGVELAAIADINAAAVEAFAKEFTPRAKYTDYHRMFENEELDIVSVCTWPGSHAEVTIAAAESRVLGILCEKPMSTNLGQADAMIDASRKNGTKLAIGHHHRFDLANDEARSLIKDGAIGRPRMITVQVRNGLLNNGTHAIDWVRYILQEPEALWVIGQLERKTDRYERRSPIEDRCVGLTYFQNDVRFLIESDLPNSNPGTVMCYGTDGTLRIGRKEIRLVNRDTSGSRDLRFPPVDQYTAELAELISWIEGKTEHRSAAKWARKTVEIIMAIYESVRIRGVVHMPLKTKESPLELMIKDGTLPVLVPGKHDIRVPF